MSGSKRTPGPWTVGETLVNGSLPIYQSGDPRVEVAKVNGFAGEIDANARLIAAAPELAEFVEDVAADIEDGCLNVAELEQFARALLAKLGGRP